MQPAAHRSSNVLENVARYAALVVHGQARVAERRDDEQDLRAVELGDDVRVLLQSPLDHALESFAPLDRQFLGIALAVLVVSLAGALFLARRVSRPLNALVDAAGRIGAGDYRTPVRVRGHDEFGLLARAFNAMQSGIAMRERQLAHNALHDPLTGLPNRALAMERLGSAISARRPVALLYLGIENYRAINEGFGPEGVEDMLREASRCLSMSLLASDTAARVSGSEFLLLLENIGIDRAEARADRLYALLTEPQRIGNDELRHEVSIGIAVYPNDGQHVEELISRAAIARHDAAMLPGYLQIYQQDRDLAHQRQITLIRDLRRAAAEGHALHAGRDADRDGAGVDGGGDGADAAARPRHPHRLRRRRPRRGRSLWTRWDRR